MMAEMRLALVMLVVACGTASAEDAETRQAKQTYKEGVRLYDAHEYKDALAAFKRASRKYESPMLFYNIAQCQRELGDKKAAVEFYKKYLDARPKAADRERIELVIGDLEKSLQEEEDARNAPPPPPAAAPSPAKDDSSVTPEPATQAAPTETTPIYKRWWLWAAVGAVVVIIAAVAIGVAAASPRNAPVTTPLFYTVQF